MELNIVEDKLRNSNESIGGEIKSKLHFQLTNSFLSQIMEKKLILEWCMVETFYDTAEFNLMCKNIWLRSRLDPEKELMDDPEMEWCLQKMKTTDYLYESVNKEEKIREILKNILGERFEVEDDEFIESSFTLIPFCTFITSRFRIEGDEDICYIDAGRDISNLRKYKSPSPYFDFISICLENEKGVERFFKEKNERIPFSSKPVWYLRNFEKLPNIQMPLFSDKDVIQSFLEMVKDELKLN